MDYCRKCCCNPCICEHSLIKQNQAARLAAIRDATKPRTGKQQIERMIRHNVSPPPGSPERVAEGMLQIAADLEVKAKKLKAMAQDLMRKGK